MEVEKKQERKKNKRWSPAFHKNEKSVGNCLFFSQKMKKKKQRKNVRYIFNFSRQFIFIIMQISMIQPIPNDESQQKLIYRKY